MFDETVPPEDQPAPAEQPADPMAELAPPDYESEENLAAVLPPDFLKAVGQRVVADWERDYESCKDWRELTAKHLKLYNGDFADTLGEQENITLIHLPYVRKAVLAYHAKMFLQMNPPNQEFVNFGVARPSLEQTVRKCARHINHQLRNEIVEYLPSQDRGTTQFLIRGSIFEVWRYDPVLGRNVSEIVLADDMAVPYTHRSDRDDLADVPRVGWRKRNQRHELEEFEDSGYYVGITQGTEDAPPLYTDETYGKDGAPAHGEASREEPGPAKEVADDSVGHHPSTNDPDAPRLLYEQDRWLRLPGEKRQRHVSVTCDQATQKVVRLVLLERDDPRDKRRYENDQALWEAQVASIEAMYADSMAQYQSALDDHMMGPQIVEDPLIPGMMVEQAAPPHPGEPPAREQDPPQPAPVKRIPFHRWIHYQCYPNPEGLLGHGLPHVIAGHNIAANKVMTRAVSKMTLGLHPTILSSRQSKLARGETRLKIGQINEVPLPPAVVQAGAGLFILQVPPPDPNVFKLEERQSQAAQELTAFDIAIGGAGMSGETATESENRHSNALDNISMVGARFLRARAQSIKTLAYLNSITLPDEGVPLYAALAPNEPPEEFVVTREDYELIVDNIEVSFTCDPRMASKPQKVRDSMKAFQTSLQIATTGVGELPVLDPPSAVNIIRACAIDVFEAMERPDLAEVVRSAAPPPPLPGQPMPGGEPGEVPPEEGMNGPGAEATDGAGDPGMAAAPGDDMDADASPPPS